MLACCIAEDAKAFLGDRFVIKNTPAEGHGTYGTVYVVQDKVTFQRFAAKVETRSDSLEREIMLLRKCQHRNLLPVLQSQYTPGGFSYFVMPLVPSNLFHFLHTNGPLDQDAAQGLFQQLINVLAYMSTAAW